MTPSFFQSLKRGRVDYLLISGQAAVLYGAATFSEDLDLWIDTSDENLARFFRALREIGAKYYKLTPPLTLPYLQRGHGFHFIISAGSDEEFYLDVMGRPPRVPEFPVAKARSVEMETDWGPIPTLNVPDLVELKKTQRIEDYPVVS